MTGRGRTLLILALVTALIVLSGVYGPGAVSDVCPGDSLAGQMWDAAWHWWDPQRYAPACRR